MQSFCNILASVLIAPCRYVYDLATPVNAYPALFQPKPLDGDVEDLMCFMQQDEVLSKMCAGRFNPGYTVLADLFIRLRYITPNNEPDFMRILTSLHSQFDYERW
ncbi:hypothetical protein C8J57DRAFT_1044748 [Mycena rebaudengoi]|nr:hypothetical protein C8J57DRAFT_1044748 [Mycena rebaudengoi]